MYKNSLHNIMVKELRYFNDILLGKEIDEEFILFCYWMGLLQGHRSQQRMH